MGSTFRRYMSLSFVSLTRQKKKNTQDTNFMIVIDKVTNDKKGKEKKPKLLLLWAAPTDRTTIYILFSSAISKHKCYCALDLLLFHVVEKTHKITRKHLLNNDANVLFIMWQFDCLTSCDNLIILTRTHSCSYTKTVEKRTNLPLKKHLNSNMFGSFFSISHFHLLFANHFLSFALILVIVPSSTLFCSYMLYEMVFAIQCLAVFEFHPIWIWLVCECLCAYILVLMVSSQNLMRWRGNPYQRAEEERRWEVLRCDKASLSSHNTFGVRLNVVHK